MKLDCMSMQCLNNNKENKNVKTIMKLIQSSIRNKAKRLYINSNQAKEGDRE